MSDFKAKVHQNRFRQTPLGSLQRSPDPLQQPDIEFGHFKRLLKAFLFGETAAH